MTNSSPIRSGPDSVHSTPRKVISISTESSSPLAKSTAVSIVSRDVVGDALVGVVVVALEEAELVGPPPREPAVDQPARRPAAPVQLQTHLEIEVRDGDDRRRRSDHGEHPDLPDELGGVVALQGVEERAVPRVEPELDQDLGEHQGERSRHQRDGERSLHGIEVTAGDAQEAG